MFGNFEKMPLKCISGACLGGQGKGHLSQYVKEVAFVGHWLHSDFGACGVKNRTIKLQNDRCCNFPNCQTNKVMKPRVSSTHKVFP